MDSFGTDSSCDSVSYQCVTPDKFKIILMLCGHEGHDGNFPLIT